MKQKIVILDYGIGNVKSIANALEHVGVDAVLSNEPIEIMNADGVILPGVGAFAVGMENLNKFGLVPVIHNYVATGKPFLGICLGMQMLLEESEEFGITKGLGLVKGNVIRIPVIDQGAKLPHVSWREIYPIKKDGWKNSILETTPEGTEVYFVHSFVANPKDRDDILAVANYGGVEFCAAIKHNNVFGTQFHPEKSSEKGLNILRNFTNLIKESIKK
jgi:imidazole glycerol-phosphate synthase subunit HisH